MWPPFENLTDAIEYELENCRELRMDIRLLEIEMNKTLSRTESISNSDSKNSFEYTLFIFSGAIGKLFLIPFTFSAVVEAFMAFRKNDMNSKASKVGLVSLIVGFAILTLILSIMGIMQSYFKFIQ